MLCTCCSLVLHEIGLQMSGPALRMVIGSQTARKLTLRIAIDVLQMGELTLLPDGRALLCNGAQIGNIPCIMASIVI